MLTVLRKAFPRTLPVLAGYLFLGIAYGISMAKNGFGVEWSLLISVVVFGGSLQFAMINQLLMPFSPLTMALMALLVQARHIFYGISMLDKYRDTRAWKPYLIFAMSDETYSLTVQGAPEGVDKGAWFGVISLLDQSYWVIGSVLGGLLGYMLEQWGLLSLIEGIDFAMTALFTVIVTEQAMEAYKAVREKRVSLFNALFPPLLGLFATLGSLLLVGTGSFLLLSMGVMLSCYLLRWFTMPAAERKVDA